MNNSIIFFKNNYELIIASILFAIIIFAGFDFYKAIILLLEFIVVLEVVKMIADFIEKRKLKLRFIIDVFIIFLIREVIILTAAYEKKYDDILFLLFVIFVFFIFRVLALIYSQTIVGKKRKSDIMS